MCERRMMDDARWTRRDFLSVTAIGMIGITSGRHRSSGADERFAYIGTYTNAGHSEGIYRLFLNTKTGAMRVDGVAAKSADPSFLALHPNGRVLYAVNELEQFDGKPTGAISAFAIARDSGALTPLGQLPSHGTAPCYVSVDKTGRTVLVANYGTGSVATFTVKQNGSLDAARTIVQHEGHGPNADRQSGPHAHCIITDPLNRHVVAADLGVDGVLVYQFDERTGKIATVANGVATNPGAGPRHLAFHPTGRFLYVINELDSTLVAYRYDGERGALDQVQVTPASPGGSAGNFPADLHVAASGRFLYGSNRGDNTIAVFAIDPSSGRLTAVQQVSTGGDWPRNFALEPGGRFLLVANQRSNSIVSFRVDPETGRLTPAGATVDLPSPVCIRFR
jgi:6-phosphogluconolactonase